MRGYIIQVMGPTIDVEFDGYLGVELIEQEFCIFIPLKELYFKCKMFISQVVDKRPINNPIQGRCY